MGRRQSRLVRRRNFNRLWGRISCKRSTQLSTCRSAVCYDPIAGQHERGFLLFYFITIGAVAAAPMPNSSSVLTNLVALAKRSRPKCRFQNFGRALLHPSTCSFEFFAPTGESKPRFHRWGFDPPVSSTQMMFIRMLKFLFAFWQRAPA